MEMKGMMTGTAKEVGAPSGNNRGGFALGDAKLDSRPLNGIETAASFIPPPKSPTNASIRGAGMSPQRVGDISMGFGQSGVKSMSRSPDRLDALLSGGDSAQSLENFVKNDEEGAHLFAQYTQAKKSAKELRTKVRNLTMDVNASKIDIDRLNQDVDQRKHVRIAQAKQSKYSAGDDVVDGEEMRLVKELKDAKQRYRNNFEQLSNKQKELQAVQHDVEQFKSQLVSCWQEWLQNNDGGVRKTLDFSSGTYHMDDMQQNNIDEMDDQEAFDKLEAERVMSNDPDSLAFFSAQKTRRANLTQSGGNIKMIQKNKRFA
jgi:kinesin family protein 6/9